MSLPSGWILTAKDDTISIVSDGKVKKTFNRKGKTVEEMVSEIDKFVKEKEGENESAKRLEIDYIKK